MCSIWERRVPIAWVERLHLRENGSYTIPMDRFVRPYLRDLAPQDQYKVLMACLYPRMSGHFQRKLSSLLMQGHLARIQQWFYTADALCATLLLLGEEGYESFDRLIHWSMENMANNYAMFQTKLKKFRKLLKKHLLVRCSLDGFQIPPDLRCMTTYLSVFRPYLQPEQSKEKFGQRVMLVTHTRATGLPDSVMIEESVRKFVRTINLPQREVHLNTEVLDQVTAPARFISGVKAKISAGSSACLESTRQNGGQTGELARITREEVLTGLYNLETMEFQSLDTPRQVRTPEDVLQYCIHQCKTNPSCLHVRVHVVCEPGKARLITVGSYPYMVLQNLFGHLWQDVCDRQPTRSGMRMTRHLWNFMFRDLSPAGEYLERVLRPGCEVFALSSDLETSTDYGNIAVASMIYHRLITHSARIPGFPVGLANFACDLYTSPRPVYNPDGTLLTIKRRGWFMGDPMTKVLLTLAQEYVYYSFGNQIIGSMVGDDLVVLSNSRTVLQAYIQCLKDIDFKVSDDDTFISRHYMTYCEELGVVPRTTQDTILTRMKKQKPLPYVDYPRVRLLIPFRSENDRFTFTDIGRFTQLGIECKWTRATNAQLLPMMADAVILQHVMVPRSPDTICPFYPEELAGDGSYHPDGAFVARMWQKEPHYGEITHRASDLLQRRFGYKFVRTDRRDIVTHKYRFWIERSRQAEFLARIPEDAIFPLKGNERLGNIILNASLTNFEAPEKTILKLLTEEYYTRILKGEGIHPPDLSQFEVHQVHMKRKEPVTDLDVQVFLDRWMNPGFRFRDIPEYFVLKDAIPKCWYLSLKWDWRDRIGVPPTDPELAVREMEAVYRFLRGETSAKDIESVLERLPDYLESDDFIVEDLAREINAGHIQTGSWVRLVSADRKLAHRIQDELGLHVIILEPLIDLLGYDYSVLAIVQRRGFNDPNIPTYRDPGAMRYVDIVLFEEGVYIGPSDLWVVCELSDIVCIHFMDHRVDGFVPSHHLTADEAYWVFEPNPDPKRDSRFDQWSKVDRIPTYRRNKKRHLVWKIGVKSQPQLAVTQDEFLQ